MIDQVFIYFDHCTSMGEYPKRSEITSEPYEDYFGDGEIAGGPSLVEISIDRGKRFEIGLVIDILTKSETHPHGIKVELHTTSVGRVKRILNEEERKEWLNKRIKEGIKYFHPDALDEMIKESSTSKFFPKSQIPPPPETNEFEFKTSFKTPTRPLVPDGQIKDPELLENVLKKKEKEKVPELKKMISNAVTALANTKGGRLFIGVNDDGKVVPTYFKKELNNNWDEYKRGISDSIKELTDSASFLSKMEFQPGEDDEFLVINVQPGSKPYYVRNKEGRKEFYMRGSGEAVVLSGDDLDDYKKERWPELYGSKKDTGRWNRDRRNYRR